ncbi:rod shape-determining protein MreD [bacterium]|nr:rod shape-determining protein MreD [bacterium]
MRPEFKTYFWYAGMMIVLVVLQVTFVPLIGIGSVQPSLPLIGLAFIALQEGATPGMLYAFPSGVMIDLYMGEVVGVSALALVAAAFALGFFHDEEKRSLLIRSSKTVVLILFASLLHGLLYVFAYFQSLDFNIVNILLLHVFGAALYTTVLSIIPVLILARTGSRLKV